MSLESLDPDLLWLIVSGPGFGESIVVRSPDGAWIVVDGCTLGRDGSPAARLLRAHEARWSCVVLTHPHLDHAVGLDEVLVLEGSGPIGCADPRVTDPRSWQDSADPENHLRHGALEQVIATLHDRWERMEEARWLMRRGERRDIGQVQLQALHPDEAAIARHGNGDPNRLATPLLVSWRGVRLLLGSDVVTEDWRSIAAAFDGLGRHAALKVLHHGSKGALHDSHAMGARERIWIVTPCNRGKKLPRFEDGEGLYQLLAHVDEVWLTGLPVPRDHQGQVPVRTTRLALRDGLLPRAPRPTSLPGGIPALRITEGREPLRCYVAVGFDADGQPQDFRHGAGSVVVREAAAPVPA